MPTWWERRQAEIEVQSFEDAERIGVRSSGVGRRLEYERAKRALERARELDKRS